MKTITMYLPQFHRTPENDEWWGEGFTEWTAVKAAKPFFEGHKQPRIPLHENYYNLLEKGTMKWQADLMKEYGIDGQCFYHYYFKDGRKILEKPAENLLKWTDINMPFCFCWANQSWARTWSMISGNAWADKFEQENGSHVKNGILLEQKYGREKEWKKHFEYLLPFFRDERYIKINGAPVFLINRPKEILCLYQMLDYWRELAKLNGFPGLFLIGMHSLEMLPGLDAVFMCALRWLDSLKEGRRQGILLEDYQEMWNHITSAAPISGGRTYYEGVINYDDSPRRGKNGIAFSNVSIDIFKKGMIDLYRKSLALNNEFVFINAWNEWGESMYLEPDEENGYAYLEAVRDAKKIALDDRNIELAEVLGDEIPAEEPKEKEWNYKLERSRRMTKCFDRWMTLREQGKGVCEYLQNCGVRTIAVYGMGLLGKHLLKEIEGGIEVKYVIDRRSELHHPEYQVKGPEDNLPPVDAVIVTPIGEFEKIYDNLKDKMQCRFFSLEELIYES